MARQPNLNQIRLEFDDWIERRNQSDWPERQDGKLTVRPGGITAIPTELTRSALFSLPRKGDRLYFLRKPLACRSDMSLRYTGEQLDQADCDVYLACVFLARGSPIGMNIKASANDLLQVLNRPSGGSSRRTILASLERLTKGHLDLRIRRQGRIYEFSMSLIYMLPPDEGGRRRWFRLDPDGYKLYRNLSYVDLAKHQQLKTSMARALHLYAVSHRREKPHDVRIGELQNWMGYAGKSEQFLFHFKRSMEQLREVGIIEEPHISYGGAGWTLAKL